MDLGLRERVAIVGGSSKGMGKATALALAREGASLTVAAHPEADLRKTELDVVKASSQQSVLAVAADLALPNEIKRVVRNTFNRFGRIDVLVNNLGSPPPGRPSELGDQQWSEMLENNFLSVVRMCREVIPFMKQQQWGRIINILASEVKHSEQGLALSTSSRLAVTGYARSLAKELAVFNITVNNVLPGLVLTEHAKPQSQTDGPKPSGHEDEGIEEVIGKVPMHRAGKPEEMGDLIAFLASERASYITGASVQLDGGLLQANI